MRNSVAYSTCIFEVPLPAWLVAVHSQAQHSKWHTGGSNGCIDVEYKT